MDHQDRSAQENALKLRRDAQRSAYRTALEKSVPHGNPRERLVLSRPPSCQSGRQKFQNISIAAAQIDTDKADRNCVPIMFARKSNGSDCESAMKTMDLYHTTETDLEREINGREYYAIDFEKFGKITAIRFSNARHRFEDAFITPKKPSKSSAMKKPTSWGLPLFLDSDKSSQKTFSSFGNNSDIVDFTDTQSQTDSVWSAKALLVAGQSTRNLVQSDLQSLATTKGNRVMNINLSSDTSSSEGGQPRSVNRFESTQALQSHLNVLKHSPMVRPNFKHSNDGPKIVHYPQPRPRRPPRIPVELRTSQIVAYPQTSRAPKAMSLIQPDPEREEREQTIQMIRAQKFQAWKGAVLFRPAEADTGGVIRL
ncbi:hypothetical protein BJ742DRAFT_903985 [Cladochytrium replicatum]|nr:hypothetical protein BJ742DRAFT_903985 [Cladochytrium replicatum]